MSELYATAIFLFAMFALLGGSVWVGLALVGVAYIGMELFTSRPAGDAMITTIWTGASSWALTALPLFIWMGEILYRTRLSEDMFRGLAPWMRWLPGGLLHTNIAGCTIFAAVSGSSAASLKSVPRSDELTPSAPSGLASLATSRAMIATTTSTSINVNAPKLTELLQEVAAR